MDFKIRAVTISDKKLRKGYYIGDDRMMIGSMIERYYPSTMSVCTGKKDRNGKVIYTHDKVKVVTTCNGTTDEAVAVCRYNDANCAFELAFTDSAIYMIESIPVTHGLFRSYAKRMFEIVGSELEESIQLHQSIGK